MVRIHSLALPGIFSACLTGRPFGKWQRYSDICSFAQGGPLGNGENKWHDRYLRLWTIRRTIYGLLQLSI